MTDYYAQAKALRKQVARLDEQATDARYIPRSSDFSDANELWCEHVRLFKMAYPKPDPRDHIQVTVLDTYRDDAFVMTTSFANLTEFNKAYNQLTWDYDLVSEQVGQCEYCDEHYLIKDECQDKGGRGFCSQGCLEEVRFERQMPIDGGEYDLFYDYHFPDGDPYDRDQPQW